MAYQPNLENRRKWEEVQAKVSPIFSSLKRSMTRGQLIAELAVATGLRYMQVRKCLDGVFYDWVFSDDETQRRVAREQAIENLCSMVVYDVLT